MGWSMLSLFISVGFDMILTAYFLFDLFIKGTSYQGSGLGVTYLLSCSSITIFTVVYSSQNCNVREISNLQHNKTINFYQFQPTDLISSVYKIVFKKNSAELNGLITAFSQQVLVQPMTFTAADFFTINNMTLTSVLYSLKQALSMF